MQQQKRISVIVAIDSLNGFAKNGQIPWNIKEDLIRFREITTCTPFKDKQNAVIFGRNTWESLGKEMLPNRINIIISKSLFIKKSFPKPNVSIFASLGTAIEFCNQNAQIDRIFICGGHGLYLETAVSFPYVDLYITKIHADYHCDTFFPIDKYNFSDWSVHKYVFNKLQDSKNASDESKKYKEIKVEFMRYSSSLKLNNESQEQQYLDLLYSILTQGSFKTSRNGNTWSLFGKTLEFDLQKGFPLITTRKIFLKGIAEETRFVLCGETDSKKLEEKKIKIWNDNTSREFLDKNGLTEYAVGQMGPMYGYQLRYFNVPFNVRRGAAEQEENKKIITKQKSIVDQIEYCLQLLKTDPFSRRILMTTYNPAQAFQGCLFPCHGVTILFNVAVVEQTDPMSETKYLLSCQQTQRSADVFLGLVWNIASYSLLTHLFCQVLNNDTSYTGPRFIPGRLILALGDTHIYESHKTQAMRQLFREPLSPPKLKIIKPISDLRNFQANDLLLENYLFYSSIEAQMVA